MNAQEEGLVLSFGSSFLTFVICFPSFGFMGPILVVFCFAVSLISATARVEVQTYDFYDSSRERSVPVVFYASEQSSCLSRPLVIINHGYGGLHTAYSYIANALVADGYRVASIQHDLRGDPPLPREGDVLTLRKPFYEQGIKTLLFVTEALEHIVLEHMCLGELVLIGHSNGGDIAMAFSDRYPSRVRAVISLDSFRCPFPACKGFPILSLRARDSQLSEENYPAEGVASVIIDAMTHSEMDDTGSIEGKKAVLDAIESFLRNL